MLIALSRKFVFDINVELNVFLECDATCASCSVKLWRVLLW